MKHFTLFFYLFYKNEGDSINKTCQSCGKEFSVPKSRDHKAKYCSRECHDKAQNRQTKLICPICGKEFYRKPSQITGNNCCSLKCIGIQNGIQRETKIFKTCVMCGKEYKVKICDSEKSVTCSIKCQGEWQSTHRVGESSSNWRGGISEINVYLRNNAISWVWDSIKEGNNKCVVTGDTENIDIHHIVSFNTIVHETFKETNIELKATIGDYSQDELKKLTNKCLQLHYKYGLGVCVRKDIHIHFHTIYGFGNNTREQWDLFLTTMQTPRD